MGTSRVREATEDSPYFHGVEGMPDKKLRTSSYCSGHQVLKEGGQGNLYWLHGASELIGSSRMLFLRKTDHLKRTTATFTLDEVIRSGFFHDTSS